MVARSLYLLPVAFLLHTLLFPHTIKTNAFQPYPHISTIKTSKRIKQQIPLPASEEGQHQPTPSPAPRRSVSDYMGGHHAGKFDFDTRISGVTSLNYEKSLVFDDLAGDHETKRILAPIDDNDDDGSLPKWATRNVFHSGGEMAKTVIGIIDISECSSGNDHVGVMIQNDEISWEPFYVSIETATGQTISPSDLGLTIAPTSGNLAPRGGANNACDASRPYSDCWEITVLRLFPSSSSSSGGTFSSVGSGDADIFDSLRMNDLYLIVRTEMNHWSWKIILQ